MGRKTQVSLLPIGCAFVLLGALNHAILHINVPHFAVILGVIAVILIAVGGWASFLEFRGAPAKSPASAPATTSTEAANAPTAEAPIPAPVAAGPDDPTIQS